MRKFDDLLIFVTVVERQSFVGAARQLGLPPGTVSRKIQELEARLGITLLNRTTRRVAVTETGRDVYEAAARGFAAIEEAEKLAQAHHDRPSGTLRIIAPHAFMHFVLAPLIPAFRALYAEIRMELIATNQPIDLIEHHADIAIRVGPQPDSSYVIRPLLRIPFRLVATPDYLAKHGRPRKPSDLRRHATAGLVSLGASISPPARVPDVYVFEKDGRREEVGFSFTLAATAPMSVFDFALESEGIGVVLENLAQDNVAAGVLEFVLSDWVMTDQIELSVLYRRRATLDSKVRLFLEFLNQRVR